MENSFLIEGKKLREKYHYFFKKLKELNQTNNNQPNGYNYFKFDLALIIKSLSKLIWF